MIRFFTNIEISLTQDSVKLRGDAAVVGRKLSAVDVGALGES